MNAKKILHNAAIIAFAILLTIPAYYFFKIAFSFWMSDFFVVIPALAVVYFITDKLIRTKRSNIYKISLALTIIILAYAITTSFMGITNQLMTLSAGLNYSLNN